jgi:hypothetical protein
MAICLALNSVRASYSAKFNAFFSLESDLIQRFICSSVCRIACNFGLPWFRRVSTTPIHSVLLGSAIFGERIKYMQCVMSCVAQMDTRGCRPRRERSDKEILVSLNMLMIGSVSARRSELK